MKFIIGIDEVGRGPLAGPVTLGIFATNRRNQNYILKNIFNNKLRDSKKLSEKQRYTIYRTLSKLKKDNKVTFYTANISNKIIDKKGISYAINLGVNRCLNNLISLQDQKCTDISLLENSDVAAQSASQGIFDSYNSPNYLKIKNFKLKILLDGGLKAPKEFKNQKTIIKGDEKEVCIACASIIAKVKRDALMTSLDSKYPLYGLKIHKGYGTAIHRNLIKKYGLSPIHRQTFCKKI